MQEYGAMKPWLDGYHQMSDTMVTLLIRVLEQNSGKFSKRAFEKEFIGLTETEVRKIEVMY